MEKNEIITRSEQEIKRRVILIEQKQKPNQKQYRKKRCFNVSERHLYGSGSLMQEYFLI